MTHRTDFTWRSSDAIKECFGDIKNCGIFGKKKKLIVRIMGADPDRKDPSPHRVLGSNKKKMAWTQNF
jgi:hypothetical protein